MKLFDVFNNSVLKEVMDSLLKHYPESEQTLDALADVMQTLLQMTPLDTANIISISDAQEDPDDPFDIHGINIDEKSPSAESELFSLDFLEWTELLGMEIDKGTLERLSPTDIAAHLLWEITFYGYDEQTIRDKEAEFMLRYKKEMEKMKDSFSV